MKLSKLVTSIAFLMSTSTAWAGATFSHEVSVSDTYLRGSVSTAAQSSDTNQYVGCYINSYSTGASVVCIARTAQKTLKSCIDSSPTQATLNAVAGISNSAYIYAVIDNGKCTRISVHNNSAFIE